MKLYKVLNTDMTSCNGGNATWKLGEWMPVIEGDLVPCENGYHLCRREDLIHWLGEVIYEVEYRGEIVEDENKVVVREARITSKLEAWNDRTARLFACDCAEQSLQYFENEYPDDKRPRETIETARKFAIGAATCDELAAARAAARDAARAAARDAAWDAAWAAAWAAAREWQTDRLFDYLEA